MFLFGWESKYLHTLCLFVFDYAKLFSIHSTIIDEFVLDVFFLLIPYRNIFWWWFQFSLLNWTMDIYTNKHNHTVIGRNENKVWTFAWNGVNCRLFFSMTFQFLFRINFFGFQNNSLLHTIGSQHNTILRVHKRIQSMMCIYIYLKEKNARRNIIECDWNVEYTT